MCPSGTERLKLTRDIYGHWTIQVHLASLYLAQSDTTHIILDIDKLIFSLDLISALATPGHREALVPCIRVTTRQKEWPDLYGTSDARLQLPVAVVRNWCRSTTWLVFKYRQWTSMVRRPVMIVLISCRPWGISVLSRLSSYISYNFDMCDV